MRIAPVIDVFGVSPTVVEAEAFIQDQQGPSLIGQTAELLIEQDAELRASTFRQLGGTTVVNGVLRAGSTGFNGAPVPGAVEFLGGVVEGTGFIYHESNLLSAVTFGPDLTVGPGNSPGTLTIFGDLEATGTTFDIEIAGRDAGTLFDQLIVNGEARFDGGILNLRFIDGFVPTENEVFQWLVVSGGVLGIETLTVNVLSDLAVITGDIDSWGQFVVASVVPVPLPPAAWALGTALAGLGALARRRSAAA